MAAHWIQPAVEKMKAKGTVGKFGKATPKKIAAAKKHGGEEKKEAVFAENMSKIAAHHHQLAAHHHHLAQIHEEMAGSGKRKPARKSHGWVTKRESKRT